MKVAELVPYPTTREVFKLSSFKMIPKRAGCYVLSTFDDEVLYIGLSVNLFDRFQQHQNKAEKTMPSIDGKAVWFYYTMVPDGELQMLERTWLNQFIAVHGRFPIFNKVNSPIS